MHIVNLQYAFFIIMIREIKRDELNKVKELAYAIWPIAYKDILSEEQLYYMLDAFYSIEVLQEQIEIKKHVFYLVEDELEKPLGFVSYELNSMLNKAKIHKIYVLPETQGTGIGKKLYELVKEKALEANQEAIFLNVNKYNNAKSFYEKLGFSIVKDEVIDIGNNYIMDDYVMEIKIIS
ncbi:GNAT family N-acetyltransferase [Flavobacterium sediminilitoris]|uniref:GNAT family N-acetyltransferase n=1 Tax=Flavobacterium sediminilitoris TaxID=2024526 RepID=A0ABY4HHC7_9FLAO|nr:MULTISPECIES: GNAT family N-acetyltransferase [Flavobacterium]UOX32250.1 GNAT family N-acetyltransferase [Flavobacterium sediminilitoris]